MEKFLHKMGILDFASNSNQRIAEFLQNSNVESTAQKLREFSQYYATQRLEMLGFIMKKQMQTNLRRWRVLSIRKGPNNQQTQSFHQRLYSDQLKRNQTLANLAEEASKAKMRECTFTPTVLKKSISAKAALQKEPSALQRSNMRRPSLSVMDKVTGLAPVPEETKPKTSVGTRLYNQAQEMEKKKQMKKVQSVKTFDFTPKTNKSWHKKKSETAVVSTRVSLGNLAGFLSPKLSNSRPMSFNQDDFESRK